MLKKKSDIILLGYRVSLFVLIILLLGSCQKPPEVIEEQSLFSNELVMVNESKENINYLLNYIRVDKTIELITEYLASEDCITYYFMLFKVQYTVNEQPRTIFATVRLIIKNDLSLAFNECNFIQGSD